MSGKEKFYENGHSGTASQKRMAQLKAWENSATNKQPSSVNASRHTPSIKFGPTIVFLAAAHSGDIDEVEKLVANNGADVNSVNKDGLTALHQCCIDDDFDMVKALVRLGANVDQQDKEGWTPLHAASSCGHAHIVSFLLDHGAFPALVNNEGDTPLDLAEDSEEILDALQERVDRDMIDMEAVRGVEEAMMLADANMLKNDHTLQPIVSHAGATPLHVAASKNYVQVIKILLSLKASQMQLDAEDEDGWTPLHAAVYWGNFLAAEELVAHGADLDKKTKAGDTIEDLCEPELEQDLNTLKKYRDQNNRKRSNAISQSNPRQLMHSNSREDMTGGKQHSSPIIVRRRSSKDRSMFPKIDIAKERVEREIFVAETGDLSSSSSVAPTVCLDDINSLSTKTSPLKINQNAIRSKHSPSEAREVAQDKDNSTKDAKGSDKTKATLTKRPEVELQSIKPGMSEADTSSSDHSPADTPHGSPPQPLKLGSPKSAKKKFTGMSPKMMMRVGQWESQTGIVTTQSPSSSTTASTPSTSSRPFPSVGRGGPLPLASSTPSMTATTSPFPTENGEGSRYPDTKRYSFQAKTVLSTSSPSIPSRSVSVSMDQRLKPNLLPYNRRASHDIRPSPIAGHCKRSSLDDTNSKSILGNSPPDQEGYRASSLPRGAKIACTGNSSLEDSGTTSAPKEKPMVEKKAEAVTKSEESEASAVATEASATPGAQTDGSFLNTTTREVSREMSVESNSSSRGATDDSETSRKIRARKTRQVRKQTQPVPSDIMDQIIKHNEIEFNVPTSSLSCSNAIGSDPYMDGPSDTNASTEDDSSIEQQKKNISQTSWKNSEKTTDAAGGVSKGTTKEDGEGKPTTVRAYKASVRPTSRVLNVSKLDLQLTVEPSTASGSSSMTVVVSPASVPASNFSALSSSSSSSSAVSSGKVKTVDAVERKVKHRAATATAAVKSEGSSSSTSAPIPCVSHSQNVDGSSPTSPSSQLSRFSEEASKNDSTEFSPHNLHPRTKSTARRKPREKRRSTGIVTEVADGEEVPEELANLVRKSGDDATTTKANSDQTNEAGASEDSSSSARVEEDKEMSRLKSLLEDEQTKNRTIEKELAELKEKILELNRRFQDATRAYEQEKKENELKDSRISELQSSYKSLQDLRHENQRMKDENSALIRVIGKLSRSPLPHHTHT